MQGYNFRRPEDALRRADELISVGQKESAMQHLFSIFTTRKFRQWQQSYEPLVTRFFDICVDLRRPQMAKEGLHQYRNITHVNMPGSLEKVAKYLIRLSEKKAADARRASKTAARALHAVEDLDEGTTPEELIMGTVTEDGAADRADRENVVPWVRFLWEVYRNVLETLRNAPKLDVMYHATCARAFAFCEEYKRPTELHRLCYLLRSHMRAYQRTLEQFEAGTWRDKGRDVFAPWPAEVIDRHVHTRFVQLRTATNMGLWTEGFRTVEDINAIIDSTKRAPRASSMATYYDSLTRIFWVSKDYLFHAASWLSLYNLSVQYNKGLTEESKRSMASSVLLAALCVPLADVHSGDDTVFDMDADADRKTAMAHLLRYSQTPTRKQLMRDIAAKGVVEAAHPDAVALFRLTEVKFDPLGLAAKASPVLERLAQQPNLQTYVTELEELILFRLVQQLSTVYRTVSAKAFTRLLGGLYLGDRNVDTPYGKAFLVRAREDGRFELRLPFGIMVTDEGYGLPDPAQRYMRAEAMIVRAASKHLLQARVDHLNGCLRLGTDAMESDGMRRQLTELARRLREVVNTIDPRAATDRDARRSALFELARKSLENMSERVGDRKREIEKRKEDFEREQQQRQRDIAAAKAAADAKRKQDEAARRERDQKRRLDAQIKKAQQQQQLAEAKRLMEQSGQDTSGLTSVAGGSAALDPEQLKEEARKKAEKAKLESEKRMREQAKRTEHLTRALREAAWRPLRHKRQQQVQADREFHEKEVARLVEEQRLKHKEALEIRDKLARMMEFTPGFEEIVAKHREAMLERRAELRADRREQKKREKWARARAARDRAAEEEAKRIEEAKRLEEADRRLAQEEAEEARRREEAEARERARQERLEREELEFRARRREEGGIEGRDAPPRRNDRDDRDNDRGGPRAGGRFAPRDDDRDAPRAGGRFAPRDDDRDAPRAGGRFAPRGDDDRDGPRGGGRFGGPRDDREGGGAYRPPRRDDDDRGGRFGGGGDRGGRFGGGGDRGGRFGGGGDRDERPRRDDDRPEGRAAASDRWRRA